MNDSTIRPNGGGTIRPGNNNNDGSTIRPDSNNDGGTIRPNSRGSGGTIRPGNSNDGSTVRLGNDNNGTVRMSGGNDGSTINMGGASQNINGTQRRQATRPTVNNADVDYKNKKRAIFNQQEIIVDGKKLHVVEYLPKISGEAQLVKVENKGKLYMLKLYFGNIHPNHDMLEKVRTIPQGMPGLMRLYQHGVWTNPMDADDKRDYEIMQYCEGGTLSDYDIKGDEEKWRKMALQMAQSINLCHIKGFAHLDVKPDNFLFVDKEKTNLVLGDFGLAVELDANGKGLSQQARTKKYAAPEIYTQIDNQLIDVFDKSDYYSLGISLMQLWMGKKEFDKLFEGKTEKQLVKLKQFDKLPLPDGLSAHSLSLLKRLLKGNVDERCGFDDIERWAKGEYLAEDDAPASQVPKMNIVYNGAKSQVAHTFEELAAFMVEDRELAKRYLYSGKLSKLLDQTNPEIALKIDEITEEWYPDDKEAGLKAAVFTLDSDYPFVDVNGKQLHAFSEIAESVLYNFDHYREALKNQNHDLYIYLRVNEAQDDAESIYRQMAKNSQDNLLAFVYKYNGKLPFRIVTDDKKVHYVNTIDEILPFGEHLSQQSQWEITCVGFLGWLDSRNGIISAEIGDYLKQEKWATECYPGILYRLNKKCDYRYRIIADANDANAEYTPAQLAGRLNKLLADYGNKSGNYIFFQDFKNINGTRLEYYLNARGLADKINYIKYCFDTNSQDRKRNPGPYNDIIAAYKCIAGLGYTPYCRCGSHIVKSLADVGKLSADVKKNELHDGTLSDWLTIHFQEKPNLNLRNKGTYERETEKYLNYISGIDRDDCHVVRFNQAVNKTRNCVDRVNGLSKRVLAMRWLVILLGLLPLGALAVYSFVVGSPFVGNPLSPFNETVFAVLAIICILGVFALSEGAGSCIGEIIWGVLLALAIYWGCYFILKLLLPYSGYIIGVLLLLYGWKIYQSCIGSVYIGNTGNLLGFDELVVAPLHFAYKSSETIYSFTPTVALQTDGEEKRLSDIIGKIKKKTLWSVVTSVMISVLFVLLGTGKNLSFISSSTPEVAATLKGSWNGEFQGRAATLVINSVDEDGKTVEGTMFVKFKRLAKENVTGTYATDGGINLVLNDVEQNGVLDGTYTISVAENGSTMTCHYRNPTSGKEVDFELTKDGTSTNDEADSKNATVEADAGDTNSDGGSENADNSNNGNANVSHDNGNAAPAASETASPSASSSKASEHGTSKPTPKKIEVEASSSSKSVGNNNGGGYRLDPVETKGNSGGGFRLDEIN